MERTKNGRNFRKTVAFTLVMAMLMSSISFGAGLLGNGGTGEVHAGVEASATTVGTATVRIIDENNNAVITNAAVSVENGVTTLGALVAASCQTEGRPFELNSYGFPATVGGIALSAGYSWMSMLNDSSTPFNSADFTNITVKDGDRIVLYADNYPSVTTYSYFTVITNGGVNVMTYGAISYVTGSVTLKLEKDVWGNVSPSTGTALILTDENGTVLSTTNVDYGLPPNYGDESITSNSGSIKLDLYGNCLTTDEAIFQKIFIVSSNDSGLVKPYCKIVLTPGGMTFTQPIDSTGFRPSDPMVVHTADISGDVAAVIDGIRDESDIHVSDYYDNDWALGIAAAGLTPTQTEKDSYLAWVLDLLANGNPSVARKAKTAIALTAFNIDARQVPNKNTGETIDLIKAVADSTPTGIDGTWDAPFMLSLYDLGNYEIPANATVTREILIDTIMSAQGSNYWGLYGTDGTGTVLPALAPYYNAQTGKNGISGATCAAISSVLDDAVTYLSSAMGEYGGFPGLGDSLNANTQGVVIAGLHSLGINTHTSANFYNSASAMDNLISYKTTEYKLGYSDSTSANDSASKQGLWALATYQNLNNERSSNLYHFGKEIAPYTNWPDADLLTSIRVTNPTKNVYEYDAAKTNEIVQTDGMVVKAIFNGDATNTTNVAIENCSVSSIDLSDEGTQTVTVSYQGYTSNFMVTVKNSDGTVPVQDKVSVSVKNNRTIIASSNSVVIENGQTTALDVLKTVLDGAGKSYVIVGNTYVSEIDGLGEFETGKNAGWLYSVNRETPKTVSSAEYELKNGDEVVWYYTLDFTKDPSSSAWVNENIPVVGTGDTISVTTNVTSKMDSQGNATASVSASQLSASIKEVVEGLVGDNTGKETEIKINVDLDENTVSMDTTISKASFGNLITNKIGMLTIASALGDISLDLNTLKTIFGEATGDITISITKAEKIDGRPVMDLSIMSNGKKITDFGGIVTVSIPYTLATGEKASGITVYYVNEEGKLVDVKSSAYDEKTQMVTFQTDHFSEFVIGYNNITFTDIQGHWAQTYIERLANRGIIKGMTETTFVPNGNITRAQFAKLLAGLEGVDVSKGVASQFNDVSQDAWYSGAVAWASNNNITLGVANADGTKKFNPNQNITRQDMAVMMKRYLELVAKKTITAVDAKIAFADEKLIADYSKEAILQLQQAGIINGKATLSGGTEFDPTGKLTRAEAAKIIASIL